MATAGDVAHAALKKILVQAGDAPLEPDEYADFYGSMNRYMSSLEARKIKLGYAAVDNIADEITIPDGALEGLIANMALRVSPDYQAPVTQELHQEARDGLTAMRRLGRQMSKTSYHTTLPRGSGDDSWLHSRITHYGLQLSAIVSLSGNSRVTTVDTQSTPVQVVGFFNVEAAKGFRGDIDGVIQNITEKEVSVDVSISLRASGSGTYTFHVMRNGISQGSVSTTAPTTAAEVTYALTLTLDPNAFIQLWVEDTAGTDNVTVADMQMRVD